MPADPVPAAAVLKPLQRELREREAQGLLRRRPLLSTPQGVEVILDGRKCINFSSNDYLGLANHPQVIAAYQKGLERYGAGSGASALICGYSRAHQALEEELADFAGRARALVFSSGYMANVGVINALLSGQDAVFEDRLNHASLLDGGLFSAARFRRYPHLDVEALDRLLTADKTEGRRLIISDGVFSMDGDSAPLPELAEAAARHEALLMLDDAHGIGCLGKDGGGLLSWWRERGRDIGGDELHILTGTFGKALGAGGAFVAGNQDLIEYLVQFCRPYIYTTALPPATAEAARSALQLLRKENWRREYLAALVSRFKARCQELGLPLLPSFTPIQAIVLGDAASAMSASEQLKAAGLHVPAIRPPTVPPGTARLRLTFSAAHSEVQFQVLLNVLERLALAGNSKQDEQRREEPCSTILERFEAAGKYRE